MPNRTSTSASTLDPIDGLSLHHMLAPYRLPDPAGQAPRDTDEDEARYYDNTDSLLNKSFDNAQDGFLEQTTVDTWPWQGSDEEDDVADFLNTSFYGYEASRLQEEASAETASGPLTANAMPATFGHHANAVLEFSPPGPSDELYFSVAPDSELNQNIQPQAQEITPSILALAFLMGCGLGYTGTGAAFLSE